MPGREQRLLCICARKKVVQQIRVSGWIPVSKPAQGVLTASTVCSVYTYTEQAGSRGDVDFWAPISGWASDTGDLWRLV